MRYWFGNPDYPKDKFYWWEPLVDWFEWKTATRRAEREIEKRKERTDAHPS